MSEASVASDTGRIVRFMPPKGYRATHCKRGHEFSGDNLLVHQGGRGGEPRRVCRQCLVDRTREKRGSSLTGPPQAIAQQEELRLQRETGTKRCSKCHERKPLAQFKRHARAFDGLYGWCRPCVSMRHRELDTPERRAKEQARIRDYVHGLPEGEYDRMLQAQGGACAICREECSSGRALAVDHDHKTGARRGLLCMACNRAIGMLGDSAQRVQQAADYLVLHA